MSISGKSLFLSLVFLPTLSLSQQQGHNQHRAEVANAESHRGRHASINMSHSRHHFVRDNGIDADYKGAVSPLIATDSDIEKGKTLYLENCSVCHGDEGLGDGPQHSALEPPPTNIARFAKMPMAKDDYLLWTIAEGGAPVSSSMPAFKDSVSVDDSWKIIAYLRRL